MSEDAHGLENFNPEEQYPNGLNLKESIKFVKERQPADGWESYLTFISLIQEPAFKFEIDSLNDEEKLYFFNLCSKAKIYIFNAIEQNLKLADENMFSPHSHKYLKAVDKYFYQLDELEDLRLLDNKEVNIKKDRGQKLEEMKEREGLEE